MLNYDEKALAEDVEFYDVPVDACEEGNDSCLPFSPQYCEILLRCYEVTQRMMKLLKAATEPGDKKKHLQNQLSVLRFISEGKNPCQAAELVPRIQAVLNENKIDLEDVGLKEMLAVVISEYIHNHEQFIARGSILDNVLRPMPLRYPLGREVLDKVGDLKEVIGVNPLTNIEINDIAAAKFITDENNCIAGAMLYLTDRRYVRVDSNGEKAVLPIIKIKKTKIE